MSTNRRIAKNTSFLYFRMMLIMGVSLFTSRIVLQKLGAQDFGLYNVVGGLVVMFSFLNGSLGAATSRFITFELGRNDTVQLKKTFNTTLIIHLLIAVIVIILAETIGLWFFYNKMTIPLERQTAAFWVYQISILTSVFSISQVPYNATLIAHEKMKIYAYVGIVEVICKLLIVYLLSFSPFDKLIFYSLLLCLMQISIMVFYRFYCLRKFPECQFMLTRDRALYRTIFKYAGSDMIGNIAVLAQGQGLNLLLNMFFGPVVNAARGIAYQVQGAITQFSSNFMTAVRPQIIKQYAEGKLDSMMNLVEISSCFSFYLLLLISLPICLESNYLLTLWLGDFPSYTNSFVVLVIVLCLIQSLKTPRTAAMHATGHIQLANIAVGTLLCLAFPLAYILLKNGGEPETVFWSAIITLFLSEFLSVFILRKYIKFSISSYLKRVHLRCFVVTLLATPIPFLINSFLEESFYRLLLTSICSTLSVGVVSWYVGLDYDIRRRVLNLVKLKIKNEFNRTL